MFLVIYQAIRCQKVEDHNTKLIPFFHLPMPMQQLKFFFPIRIVIHISPVRYILPHLQHVIIVFVKPYILVGGTIVHWNVLPKPS